MHLKVNSEWEISIQNGEHRYCDQGKNYEIAIFKNGDWYTGNSGVPELEKLSDSPSGEEGIRVFGYVPWNLIEKLISRLS